MSCPHTTMRPAAMTTTAARAPLQERPCIGRRALLHLSFVSCASQLLSSVSPAVAAETEDCATCLGEVDGTLGSCAGLDGCLSSFDDRPKHFVNPWEYDGVRAGKMAALRDAVQRSGGEVTVEDPLYLRAEYSVWRGDNDVLEFLFESDDNVVELRGVAGGGLFPQSRLQGQFEQLRAALRWDEVYILRNRKRFFGVLESPLDTFGDETPLGYNIDNLNSD